MIEFCQGIELDVQHLIFLKKENRPEGRRCALHLKGVGVHLAGGLHHAVSPLVAERIGQLALGEVRADLAVKAVEDFGNRGAVGSAGENIPHDVPVIGVHLSLRGLNRIVAVQVGVDGVHDGVLVLEVDAGQDGGDGGQNRNLHVVTLSGFREWPSLIFVVPWDILIVPHFGVLVKGFCKLFLKFEPRLGNWGVGGVPWNNSIIPKIK